MGKLFYILGKSASGKDKIYSALLADPELDLRELVLYTTRPIRKNEENGKQYFFVSEEEKERMEAEGRVIEERTYQTVAGPWTYFTADGALDLSAHDYLGIGTIESYEKLKAYYGEEILVPIYVETDDDQRLLRAIRREMKQESPNLKEVCRRFLADSEDFSEEKIASAGIARRFQNNGELSDAIAEIGHYIRDMLK